VSRCRDDGWNLLEKDTDCTSCHYTVRASDRDGMLFVNQLPFCDEGCHEDWVEENGVDSSSSRGKIDT